MPTFVDATYYVALLLPRDRLHAAALDFIALMRDEDLVTSDPVLVETMAHLSGLGSVARASAVDLVHTLRKDNQTTIVRQTPDLFDAGFALYERRIDKGYSLTDCKSRGISAVLTYDHHFEQEGFTALMR